MIDNYLESLYEGPEYIPMVLGKINFTAEDLQNFESIGAIFQKGNKILMLDHVKFNFWSVPIGKVPEGKTVEQGLKIEMKEELDVKVTKYRLLNIWKRTFYWQGKTIKTKNHLYYIDDYNGRIKNNEPHKARSLKYMTIDEIRKRKISVMTEVLLKLYDRGEIPSLRGK